jgi:hypothetical protein
MKNSILILMLLFTSCEKGPQGEPGKDGNANVVNSEITIHADEWQYTNYLAYCTLQLPEITSDVINNGAVTCYLESFPDTWSVLPYSIIQIGNKELMYSYNLSVGEIFFYVQYDELIPISGVPDRTYKLVIISG